MSLHVDLHEVNLLNVSAMAIIFKGVELDDLNFLRRLQSPSVFKPPTLVKGVQAWSIPINKKRFLAIPSG